MLHQILILDYPYKQVTSMLKVNKALRRIHLGLIIIWKLSRCNLTLNLQAVFPLLSLVEIKTNSIWIINLKRLLPNYPNFKLFSKKLAIKTTLQNLQPKK